MAKRIDLTGQRFGRLTVTEKILMQNNFIYGQTKSCGCLSREMRAARAEHMRQSRKRKSDLTREPGTVPQQSAVEVNKCAKKIAEQNLLRLQKTACGCKKGRPTKSDAEFFKKHGCSVCADNKSCDMTSCKYEKELIS